MALLCWPELMSVQFAADIFAEYGIIASKTKFAPGPVWYYIARRLDKAVIFGVERLPRIGV